MTSIMVPEPGEVTGHLPDFLPYWLLSQASLSA